MPRRYYRYRPRRGCVSRRKWSPTLIQGNFTLTAGANPTGSTAFHTYVLCANSANQGTNVPVSTIIKVKNFKVVFDITSTSNSFRNNFYAIMFLPQGFVATANTPQEHPEWIMVWRTIDTTSASSPAYASGIRNFQMSSRLTRNLNSGDSIILYQYAVNPTSGEASISTGFFASFVTCNN